MECPLKFLNIHVVLQNRTLEPNPTTGALGHTICNKYYSLKLSDSSEESLQGFPIYFPVTVQLAHIQLYLAVKITPKNFWKFPQQLIVWNFSISVLLL